MFTLLGFMGLYTVLGILFLFVMRHELETGPAGKIEPISLPAAEAK
jgi:cytochrome bd-type quinol oxidase subunit 1